MIFKELNCKKGIRLKKKNLGYVNYHFFNTFLICYWCLFACCYIAYCVIMDMDYLRLKRVDVSDASIFFLSKKKLLLFFYICFDVIIT